MNRSVSRLHPVRGSALLVALLTITVLALIAGYFVSSLTARSRTAYRSASWSEAGFAAESGADLAVAEIRRVLPTSLTELSAAWLSQLSATGSTLSVTTSTSGVTLGLTPSPLVHGGEGNTTQSATVAIDAPVSLGIGGRQWFRIRSIGSANVPGARLANPSKLDNRLRKLRLLYDSGAPISAPRISRTAELIVRPVLPFETAVRCENAIDLSSSVDVVDSFDSSNPLVAPNGIYDSTKRLEHGGLYSNTASLNFAGELHGDAGSNGGTLAASTKITGSINNNYYRRLPPISAPTWAAGTYTDSSIAQVASISGGTALAPTRYKFSSISNLLTVSPGLLGAGSYAEIWVNGDILGKITVESGVNVTIYVAGDIKMNNGDLDNRSGRAASVLIYGIQPAAGQSPVIQLDPGKDIEAAIYAPGHAFTFTNKGDFMGAITAKSVTSTRDVRIHYDEALKYQTGKILDYRIVSWVEDVR